MGLQTVAAASVMTKNGWVKAKNLNESILLSWVQSLVHATFLFRTVTIPNLALTATL
jgi:hypothetical protein